MHHMSATNHKLVDAAIRRLVEATRIADSLKHNDKLHQLAMVAVFALEDCVFELTEMERERKEKSAQDQRIDPAEF